MKRGGNRGEQEMAGTRNGKRRKIAERNIRAGKEEKESERERTNGGKIVAATVRNRERSGRTKGRRIHVASAIKLATPILLTAITVSFNARNSPIPEPRRTRRKLQETIIIEHNAAGASALLPSCRPFILSWKLVHRRWK